MAATMLLRARPNLITKGRFHPIMVQFGSRANGFGTAAGMPTLTDTGPGQGPDISILQAVGNKARAVMFGARDTGSK